MQGGTALFGALKLALKLLHFVKVKREQMELELMCQVIRKEVLKFVHESHVFLEEKDTAAQVLPDEVGCSNKVCVFDALV